MTNPKLALIPSGYKGGTNPTVYSILPSDGSGDFTFDRANGYASRVRKDGLIEEVSNDVPRLDWSDGNCPSLLLEPQRTNLLKYSEDYSQSEWSKIRSTISTNQSIAPNGTFTADKIIASTDNNTHRCDQAITLTDGTTYSLSFFVKSSEYNCIRASIGQSGLTFGNVASFNLNTKTVSTTGTIENAEILDFGNGWFRCVLTMDAGTTDRIVIGLGIDDSYSFAGDNSSGLFMWGAMIEEASYTSSYIKTEGEVGGVTRLKDECFNGGDADLFNITEGTFFVDANNFGTPLNDYSMITISDATGSNYIRFIYESSRIRVSVLGLGDYFITGVNDNERNKVATTFKENEMKVFFNGSLVHTDTLGVLPTGLSKLNFSMTNNLSRWFEGKVHDTRVYDRVLTEAEAIELTTL